MGEAHAQKADLWDHISEALLFLQDSVQKVAENISQIF